MKYCLDVANDTRVIFLNWHSIIYETSHKFSGKPGQKFAIQKNFNWEKLVYIFSVKWQDELFFSIFLFNFNFNFNVLAKALQSLQNCHTFLVKINPRNCLENWSHQKKQLLLIKQYFQKRSMALISNLNNLLIRSLL